MSTTKNGFVSLAGAGPGDAELITVKLQKRLAAADVIITDRLVNPDIISSNAHPSALLIQAGKQGYNELSYSQEQVTSLILQYAREGKQVLRLKGGDVAFFSNVLDELQALVANDIPFEIIPGITAGSGASAYTGIPLTARGYAQGVQFIAFNPQQYFTTGQWKQIAQSRDTLVFYMAAKNIVALTEMMLRYSKHPKCPLAVIEQASTMHQKVHISSLQDAAQDFREISFSSPSLVIIGDVVTLQEQFNWFHAGEAGTVFRPLAAGSMV